MAKKLPRCDACGRVFRPDRYNKHDQIYCLFPECVLARKRKRQRKSYNRRYRGDPEFRQSERDRAADAARRRRSAAKTACSVRDGPSAEPSAAAVSELCDLFTGFVSHLSQSDDPSVVRDLMSGYADRGRRLAAEPEKRFQQVQETFFNVPRHPF